MRLNLIFRRIIADKFISSFAVSLAFLFLLYFNINNKTLMILAAGLIIGLYAVYRNFETALFHGYLLLLPFIKGKGITFPLIPAELVYQQIPFNLTVNFTVSDLMLAVMMFIYIRKILLFKSGHTGPSINPVGILMYILLICLFIASYLSKIPLLSFLLTFPVFGYIFTFFYVKKQKQADIFRILFCCLSALFIFEGVWSGMQFIGRSPLGKPIESIIDESTNKDWAHTAVEDYTYFRAQGTFSHPNYLGIFIAAFMPLVIYPALVAKWPTGLVFASVTGFSAGLIALIVSGSRTSWIGLAISVAAEIWFLKQNILFKPNAFFLRIVRYSVILFLLILPVLIIPRLSQFSTTVLSGGGVDFRISLLKNSLTMISNNPLGVGLGMYPYILFHEIGGFTSYPTEPHNLLTQISVSGGLIAGISFILLIYISIRKYLTKQFFKNIRITENYILIISLSAFLFISGFYPVLTEQPVIGFFWIILGAVDS